MKFPFDFSHAESKKRPVALLAGLRARTGQEGRLLKLLRNLAVSTRRENGCLCNILHQSEADSELFTIYQIWEGEEFLEAHAKTSHTQSFRGAAPDLLEGPVLHTRWKIVD
jgi:quinol monooxygenase YgiN